MARKIVTVIVLASMVLATVTMAQAASSRCRSIGTDVMVSDGKSTVRFSKAGMGALVSLTYGEQGENLVAPEWDLWIIELNDGTIVKSSGADSFSTQEEPSGPVMVWQFNTLNLTVRVGLKALADSEGISAQWSAQSTGGITVKEIQFPRLKASKDITNVTNPMVGQDAFPSADGLYGGFPGSQSYTYPGGQVMFQFFAAWDVAGNGLYVGTHDGQGYSKSMLWDNKLATFTFHQPDPQISRTEVTLPYPVVFAAFEGDWQDGADYYRNWAHNNAPWCQRGTLDQIGPVWAKQSTAWFYDISDFPVVLTALAPRLREVFGLTGPIGVHSLAPQPQEEGAHPVLFFEGDWKDWYFAMKQRMIPIMQTNDYHVFQYRNFHKYTEGYTGYNEAAPYAFQFDGSMWKGQYRGAPNHGRRHVPLGTPDSIAQGVGVDAYGMIPVYGDPPIYWNYNVVEMCIGTSWWQNKLLESVGPCPGLGFIGNYLDQIGQGRDFSRCDDPSHGHPLGGGNWYVRGHEQVLNRIIQLYQDAGVDRPLLSHEYFSEPLVGLLNAALCDWDIRLLSYLYHPYIIFESHNIYGWKYPSLATLRTELAHDFHSGRMPSLSTTATLPGVDLNAVLSAAAGTPADEPALVMMRQWFGVRSAWLSYLNLGLMLHTPKLSAGSGEIMTSAWKNPDGDITLFFSNATDQTQTLIFDTTSYPVVGTWHAWKNDRQDMGIPTSVVTVQLASDETYILEAIAP